MFPLSAFIYIPILSCVVEQSQSLLGESYPSNSINCQNDKPCTFIEHCPVILKLMNQNLLPVHRFRQAICGYDSIRPKVCCDVGRNLASPVYTQEDGAPFTRSNSILECGKSFARSNRNAVGTYPFVARVGFRCATGEMKYPCNGVILNERTILTTASCALAKSDDYKLHSVLVGEFNTETDPECNRQKLNISYVIKHPNYQANTLANNIAMLRLKEPMQYTVTAQPACLSPVDRYPSPSVTSTLVGWGRLSTQNGTKKNKENRDFEYKILRAADSGNEDSVQSRMFELLRSRDVRRVVRDWRRNALRGLQWKPPFNFPRRRLLSVRHLVVRFELRLSHQLPVGLCQRSKTVTLDPRELLIIRRRAGAICA